MSKKKNKKVNMEIAVESIGGAPETAFDLVRKYGTYEIQPTADTANVFPTIAQGMPKTGIKPAKDSVTTADDGESN